MRARTIAQLQFADVLASMLERRGRVMSFMDIVDAMLMDEWGTISSGAVASMHRRVYRALTLLVDAGRLAKVPRQTNDVEQPRANARMYGTPGVVARYMRRTSYSTDELAGVFYALRNVALVAPEECASEHKKRRCGWRRHDRRAA